MSMSMSPIMAQKMSQNMILAPRMIQSMEILQLPIMALQERIQQELQENPVLELRDSSDEQQPAAADGEESDDVQTAVLEDTRDPGAGELVIDESGSNELDFDRLEALSKDWEDHFNEEHRPSRNGMDDEGDKKHDAMQNMASRPQSLQDYLSEQLSFADLPPDQAKLVRYVIAHIDDNGFLSVPDETDPERHRRRPPTMEELAQNYDHGVTPAQVEEALRIIQKLDPPGVGARDTRECLLLQLTPDMPHREILRTLILNHLEDIAHNRHPAIQRRTGFDLNAIKEAIEDLRHLNLRPGSQFSAEHAPYVVPDILVERNRGRRIHGAAARRLAAEHLHQPSLHRPVAREGGRPQDEGIPQAQDPGGDVAARVDRAAA